MVGYEKRGVFSIRDFAYQKNLQHLHGGRMMTTWKRLHL
jgi:hypothetical protein